MQVTWNGRDGKNGKDKSILTIQIEPETENSVGRIINLKPGINDGVSEEDWKVVLKIEVIQWYIQQGCLEVVQAETLERYSESAAADMAKQTIDMNLLAKWRRAELASTSPRLKVIASIDKQLTDMTTPPEAVKKAQEEARAKKQAQEIPPDPGQPSKPWEVR
jgi:hypothetical protein